MNTKNASLLAAMIYTSISLAASGLFLAITWRGEYTWVARLGGAGWVFLLAMIILMPMVIPRVKTRLQA